MKERLERGCKIYIRLDCEERFVVEWKRFFVILIFEERLNALKIFAGIPFID